jgi:hypothetical protein
MSWRYNGPLDELERATSSVDLQPATMPPALGRFVDYFARVETAVTLTPRLYAQTSGAVAKIIFAGTRIEAGGIAYHRAPSFC